MVEARNHIENVAEDIEGLIPQSQRARLKVFLDQLMPAALVLLGSMVTFTFFISPGPQLSYAVSVLNVALVVFFAVRLGLAFSLADSHGKFLRQHWFDALLVLPALALVKEIRVLTMIESETEERAIVSFIFARTTVISSQIARIYTWGRRILRF